MPQQVEITRRLEWDAAHRVLRHESKCATLHGHHYVALVTIHATHLDDRGRVVDFGVVKEKLGAWVDENLDHTTIVNERDLELLHFCQQDAMNGKRAPYVIAGEPTAENIATMLYDRAAMLLESGDLHVVKVEVFETPNCSATAWWGDRAQEYAKHFVDGMRRP
jgi:6-pyruvoyltetrahydropterin/6-carboxytetrahydropterin synthase